MDFNLIQLLTLIELYNQLERGLRIPKRKFTMPQINGIGVIFSKQLNSVWI